MGYRAGIIGCGGISSHHAAAYRNDRRMELVAAAEPSAERRARFAEKYGVRVYSSAADMLAEEKLDIVSVCTPHPDHREPTVMAAQAGAKAVLCEKPIALNLGDADEMIRTCRERGVLLVIGHQRRFQPGHIAIAKPLLEGEIGKLTDIWFDVHHYDLMTWGTHAVDMIRWYNGDAPTKSVFGQVDISVVHERHGAPAEDSAISLIHFENGLRATLACGSMVPRFSQVIAAEEGELRVEGDPSVARIRRQSDVSWREIPKPAREDWQEGFDGEVRALGDSLETGAPHPLAAEAAREALAVIIATYESSRRRRVVTFPIEVPDNPLLAMLAERSKA